MPLPIRQARPGLHFGIRIDDLIGTLRLPGLIKLRLGQTRHHLLGKHRGNFGWRTTLIQPCALRPGNLLIRYQSRCGRRHRFGRRQVVRHCSAIAHDRRVLKNWIKHATQLIGGKAQNHQHQHQQTQLFKPARPHLETPDRQNPMQGHGCQQQQPFVTGRADLLIGQDQRRQRHNAPADSPQFSGRQRDQQHQKEIQQIPLRQPRTISTISASGMEQPPTGGQRQRHRDTVKVVFPAYCRQIVRRTGNEAIGAHHDFPALKLDAGLPVGILSNELILPFDIDPPQHRRSAHHQARSTADIAGNTVAHGHRMAVEPEPEPPFKRQLVWRRLAVATANFLKAKACFWPHQIARQTLPLLR